MPTIFRDKVTVQPDGGSVVTFNDPLVMPVDAAVWGLDVLDGWKSTSELDDQFIPYGTVDGEVANDFFPANGRQLTIAGYVLATTREAAEALADVIIGDAFPRNKDLIITRYEPVPKWVRGRVSGKRDIMPVGPQAFRWAVPVRCPNPLKFALTPIVSGNVGVAGLSSGGRTYPRTYPLQYTTVAGAAETSFTVVNAGTGSTYPIVTIHGPLPANSWRLVNETTGDTLRINIGLSSTDTMVIDFENQTVYLNGFLVFGDIIGDFWQIQRGSNVIKLYGDYDPAAYFSVTAYSGWEN